MKPRRSLKLTRPSPSNDECPAVDDTSDGIVDVDANETEKARATTDVVTTVEIQPTTGPDKTPKSNNKRRSADSEEAPRTLLKKSSSISKGSETTPAKPVNTLTRYFSPMIATLTPPHSSASTPAIPSSSPSSHSPPTSSPCHEFGPDWHVVVSSAGAAAPLESCDDVLKLARDSPLAAYAFHVHHVVKQVVFERRDTRHLFTAEESSVFHRILSLSPGALGLFARLLSRKGPWFRVTSCLGYVFDVKPQERQAYFQSTAKSGEKPILPPNVLLSAVRELIASELVLELPAEITAETLPATMQALESCFRVPELRTVLSKLCGKCDTGPSGALKPSAAALKNMPKPETLASIRSILASQRTMAGSSVQGLPFITSVLQEVDGDALGLTAAASAFTALQTPIIVRLNANVVALVRRVYRLYYLSSSTGSTSSGGSGNAVHVRPANGNSFVGRAVASQNTADITNLNVFSVSNLPLLMTIWKKARYQCTNCVRKSVVFPTRNHVVCYEAAIVLNEEFEEYSMAYIQAKRANAKLLTVSHTVPSATPAVKPLLDDTVEIDVDGQGDDVDDVSKRRFASGKGAVFVFHPAFGYRKEPDGCCFGLDLLPALAGALSIDASSSVGLDAFHTMTQLFGLADSAAEGRVRESEAVPDCVLIAWRASYCLAACAHLDTSPEALTPVDGHCISFSSIPPFLRQFEPGYCFATAVWRCVDVLEQERYLVEAIVLLRQLLNSRFTPHRRGRWWDRLSIDYAHVDRPVDACVACIDALDDPCVSGGDKITLQRRLTRLSRKHGAAATAKRRQRGRSGASPTPSGFDAKDSADPTSFLDTLKAIAMSSVVERVSGGYVLPKYISAVKGWIGGVRGEESIVGNPTNRVTGEKSRFIGKEAGSDLQLAETAAKRRERLIDGSLPGRLVENGEAGFVNITQTVMDGVNRDGKATTAVLIAANSPKKVSTSGGPELDIDVDVDAIAAGQPMTSSDTLVSVEEYALQHYEAKGGWAACPPFVPDVSQVIFSPVDDVFQSSFQDGPIDLDFSACFYANRRERIEATLTTIARMDDRALIAAVRKSYVANYGKSCRGVSWSSPLQLLQLIAVCASGATLAHIFDALCRNHKHFSGGLPDLLLWRVLTPCEHSLPSSVLPPSTVEVVDVSCSQDSTECASVPHRDSSDVAPTACDDEIPDIPLVPGARYEAMCVEVKGPRDRLSDKQRAWIQILTDAGLPVDVCYVKESHSRSYTV